MPPTMKKISSLLLFFAIGLSTPQAQSIGLIEGILLNEVLTSGDDEDSEEEERKPPKNRNSSSRREAIVRISIKNRQKTSTGTGFFMKDKNTLITSFQGIAALLNPKSSIQIHTRSGREIQFVRIKQQSALYDIAVLEVDGYEGSVLKETSSSYNTVYVLGFNSSRLFHIIGENIQYHSKDIYFSVDMSPMNFRGGAGGAPILDAGIDGVDGIVQERIGNFFIGAYINHWRYLLNEPDLSEEKTPIQLIQEEISALKEQAEKGNKEALYRFAMLLSQGIVQAQNNMQVEQLFREAAKKGNIKAKYQLALMIIDGKRDRKVKKKSLNYFKKQVEKDMLKLNFFLIPQKQKYPKKIYVSKIFPIERKRKNKIYAIKYLKFIQNCQLTVCLFVTLNLSAGAFLLFNR